MGAPNVTLPEGDKAWLEEHAHERGFASADEYAHYLVAEERASRWWAEQEPERRQSIRAHIDEGWRQSEAGETVELDRILGELQIRRAALNRR